MSTLEYVINSLLVKPDTGKVDPLALNFLSCFAICDSSKVKNFYVMELKSAIGRILALPESIQKHYHLRALLDLISTSIEHVSAQMSRHAGLPPGANLPMQKELNTISALMVKPSGKQMIPNFGSGSFIVQSWQHFSFSTKF